MNKDKIIRIPISMHEKLNLYSKTTQTLMSKLQRKVSIDEVAREMNISTLEAISLQKLIREPISLNTEICGEKLESFVSSSDSVSLDDTIITEDLPSQIQELLRKCNIPPRQIEILMLRYGFYSDAPKTLEEIGKQYGVTRERIRQLEAKTLKKIRESEYVTEFVEYMQKPNIALKSIGEFRKKYKKYRNVTGLSEQDYQEKYLQSAKTDDDFHTQEYGTIEECNKMLELLRTPKFKPIMDILTEKEALIVFLKLCYVDGKLFTSEIIAQFLGIKKEEVLETAKRILLIYREQIDTFLYEVIYASSSKDDGSKALFIKPIQ